MKTLSLAQPRIIMIAGIPGAGKSTFGTAFADMFGVSFISADKLRHELFANPQYAESEEAIITRLQELMMQEIAKNKRSFLIEGSCDSRPERLKIEQFAKTNGFETLIIWVQTNPETAKGRATGRIRKPADTPIQPISPDVFEKLSKKFTPPKTEDYVVISGMHTFNTQVRMVLRKLTGGTRPAEPVHQKQRPAAPGARGIVVR